MVIGGDAVSGFWVKVTHTAPTSDENKGAKIKARDSSTVSSSYAHMKRYPAVQVGQYVGAGTLLGYEGTTGKSGGYHCHLNIKLGAGRGTAANPVRFMYPFFTPFWYEEKAEDAVAEAGSLVKALGSEYYSLERTVWPFGEKAASTSPEPSIVKNIKAKDTIDETNIGGPEIESGMIKMSNYTPRYALVPDATLLPTENVIDYSKLSVDNVTRNSGKTTFDKELVAIPDYADPEFIEKVKDNNYKIQGLPIGLTNNP